MMVKTQQFDPKDLGVGGRGQEDSGLAADVLTGDDVSSRMETMFEIGGEAPPAAEPEMHDMLSSETAKKSRAPQRCRVKKPRAPQRCGRRNRGRVGQRHQFAHRTAVRREGANASA